MHLPFGLFFQYKLKYFGVSIRKMGNYCSCLVLQARKAITSRKTRKKKNSFWSLPRDKKEPKLQAVSKGIPDSPQSHDLPLKRHRGVRMCPRAGNKRNFTLEALSQLQGFWNSVTSILQDESEQRKEQNHGWTLEL